MEENGKKIITIGKLKISYPSFIMAISGIVVSIILSFFINIWFGISVLPVFLLAAYNVNCSIVGHCYVWAWILTSLFLLQLISYIFIIMMTGRKGIARVLSKRL